MKVSVDEKTNFFTKIYYNKKKQTKETTMTTSSARVQLDNKVLPLKSVVFIEHVVKNNENNPTKYVQFYLFDYLKGFIKAFNPAGKIG